MERSTMTALQEKQLRYLDIVERREARSDSLAVLSTLECYCRTCKVGRRFNSAEGARCFIQNHEGHNTWLTDLGSRAVTERRVR